MKSIQQVSCVLFLYGVSSGFGQSNDLLISGNLMTNTLSVEVLPNLPLAPAIELFGPSSTYKYIHFENTTDGAVWNMVMASAYDENKMFFTFSPNGTNRWITPFSIDSDGVLYGNAAGLTNLNIVIPKGSIGPEQLAADYLTNESFTNGDISSFSVGGSSWSLNSVKNNSLAVGIGNIASNNSFASGVFSKATGISSFAAGSSVTASGNPSHAEGSFSRASGNHSHAEGYATVASGNVSHAEGSFTTASGYSSHAAGYLTTASGKYSHAAGLYANAAHDNTFIWSSGELGTRGWDIFSSTTNKQFSVYAKNGIRLEAGSNAGVEIKGSLTVDGPILTAAYGDIPMFVP